MTNHDKLKIQLEGMETFFEEALKEKHWIFEYPTDRHQEGVYFVRANDIVDYMNKLRKAIQDAADTQANES